jgi:lysophospholipid acyltransferase (LPLAT)-like uncharacterized protein
MNGKVQPKAGVIIPHRATWGRRVAARGIQLLVRLMTATIQFRLPKDFEQYAPVLSRPVIFCLWHNRLSVCTVLYDVIVTRSFAGRRLAAMVSASRDGGMLARALELFGIEPVRGSSSRRGRQALLELTSWAEKGCDLAITPDGPRGPRYQIQDGIVALAQVTGLPIVPVSCHLSWKICLRSWDLFQVPLPFARCAIRLAEPVRIPRESTDEEREALRLQLENRMREITRD